MYKVPLVRPYFGDEEKKAIIEAMDSCWWATGPKTKEFEDRFAEYVGTKYAIAVNSGTSAIKAVWAAIKEISGTMPIFTPAITFSSPIQATEELGFTTSYVDIDEKSLTMKPDFYGLSLNNYGIMTMHYGGQPCDMDLIQKFNRNRATWIIEDASHATGANYKGRMVGSLCDAAVFSLHPIKVLSSPLGGIITTNNSDIAERIRAIKFFGINKDPYKRQFADNIWEYDVTTYGTNYYMGDLTATVAIEQLKKLPYMIERRREIAAKYSEAFTNAGIDYVKYNKSESVHHLYVLLVNNRDIFINKFKDLGIQCNVHYIPIYHFSYWNKNGRNQKEIWSSILSNTEYMFNRMVTIPLYVGMTDENVLYVIESVLKVNEELNGKSVE